MPLKRKRKMGGILFRWEKALVQGGPLPVSGVMGFL